MQINLDSIIKQGVEQAMEECKLSIGMTLKEAVVKQTGYKPNNIKVFIDNSSRFVHNSYYGECTSCKRKLIYNGIDGINYCQHCGQKLDWSDSCVKSDISCPKFAKGGIVNTDVLFVPSDKLFDVKNNDFKQTVDAGFDLSYRNDMVDAMIYGLKVKVIEKQDVSFETIVPTLSMATSVVMEELRKHEDWYNTWVQMIAKCIEECDGQMTNDEIAKCFIDDYLIGSD